ncbi:MAG: DUF1553 domain-containing protein, partial [Planctomycetes bacterium]|nr:DUF1553 domain-containing protein [Planctomycetota bacterium]
LIARAFVNRMWSHFFGHGFTRPVDDSGPHNPPSHPELLDRLSTEFVNSGYDVKRLMRWITNTEAYGLTSKVTAGNATDDPSLGETPRFTHVSVKPMTAEQLYDSLIVATNAHTSGRSGWEQSESRRQEWLQQFVQAFGTDEGDEASSFDGTIPQALMMMNGELVSSAINSNSAGRLSEILASKGNDVQKIRKLYMTVLCREPSKKELSKLQPFLKGHADHTTVFQDLYWALLNSNEFIFNH